MGKHFLRVSLFSWRASAFIYHNLGLVVSQAARSFGVPLSQYIDDRHVGQLFSPPMRSISPPSAQRAQAAAYIVCYILKEAGYFINIGKSQCVPSTVIRFLGFPLRFFTLVFSHSPQ